MRGSGTGSSSLRELLDKSCPLVFYELGMDYGYDVAAQSRDKINSTEEAIKFLEYYGLLIGGAGSRLPSSL